MSANIMQEIYFLIHAIIMGVLITFAYDWIRIFRRVLKHNLLAISLEDLLFWISCSIAIFLMLYRENNGTLRWFAIIGAAVGMMLYKLTISYFLVKYVTMILQKILALIAKITKKVWKPIKIILEKEYIMSKRASGKVRGLLRICKKRLTVFIKMIRIMLCKQ